ncbi:MAG: flagellum-specific ATP synthase FliI, partial [Burkholderiales bacterium]|nr:flagellum-specific ATP synthase FliI [Burkholderiales bacterium]
MSHAHAPLKYSALWQSYLRDCGQLVEMAEPMQMTGRVTRVTGLLMEAVGLKLPVGAACTIGLPGGGKIEAEVVGFENDKLFLMPQSDIEGIVPGTHIWPIETVQSLPKP